MCRWLPQTLGIISNSGVFIMNQGLFYLLIIIFSIVYCSVIFYISEGINLLHVKGSVAVLFGVRNVTAYFSKIPMWWWYGMGGYEHLKTSVSFQRGVCASSFSIILVGGGAVYLAMGIPVER